MSKLIKSVSLGFTNNHSDKVYIVEMFESETNTTPPLYNVICRYGRRLTPNSEVNLVTESKGFLAEKVFNRQVALKAKKGYTIEDVLDFGSKNMDQSPVQNPKFDQPPIPMRQNIGKRVVGW
jgi:hypothetical protein